VRHPLVLIFKAGSIWTAYFFAAAIALFGADAESAYETAHFAVAGDGRRVRMVRRTGETVEQTDL
jgi:hypothetical protein